MAIDYRPRVSDGELAAKLEAGGAVLIEGPRACGKTETASQAAHSEVRLDVDHAARAAGLIDPTTLLEGEKPHLIDEWQLVPEVWNQVRRAVGDRAVPLFAVGSVELRRSKQSRARRISSRIKIAT